MRVLTLCSIGIVFILAGCGSYEGHSPTDAGVKASATECPTGDCCSSVSRSSLMQGKKGAKIDDQPQ